MTMRPPMFRSFFLGGFECSTHRRADGRRLDLLAATGHDRRAAEDYRQAAEHGIRTIRDGIRWHLIEVRPGEYDWSSVLPMLRAAEAAGTEVIWDLCHYGWPDHLDIWSAGFVEAFAAYAAAFARLHREETGRPPLICPVNEIAFLAWAGGDVAIMNPCAHGRGDDLKRQLVRAALAGGAAVRAAVPGSRIFAIDPLIHIVPRPHADPDLARHFSAQQYEGWDMLTGRREPELGGSPDAIDAIGVNFYWNNQWLFPDAARPPDAGPDWRPSRDALSPYDPRWRPFRAMLAEVHARYGRPLFVAETSIEAAARPDWLRHVCEEVRAAMAAGVPVGGICLYPVLSHPGWDDDRYCPNGLFEMATEGRRRVVDAPLAAELARQQALFGPATAAPVRLGTGFQVATASVPAHHRPGLQRGGRAATLDIG
ncbi:beta-glucosidase [Belnapia sp. T6]|uniref:Beta-glucosidase n=1 Tax=Belnapia mucosa TaxID=2804532 RepID=A0ABS1UZC2_9PROT|nr:beta-glucosidase [Belnapia mucosa]MBL6454745.1 beta-glucosidase [Belnapia mucosa]